MQSTLPDSPEPSEIIRTGSDGRLRFSREHRKNLLAAHARSGLSAMAFASQHGVKYPTFIAWLRKSKEEQPSVSREGPAFAEVFLDRAEASASAAGLRVILPCGALLEIGSRAALPLAIELLSAMRRPC